MPKSSIAPRWLAGIVLVMMLGCSSPTGAESDPVVEADGASDAGFETHAIFPSEDTGALVDTQVADTHVAADTSAVDASALDTAPPTKVVLTVTWKGQETGYWCGPGSTRMALSTRMSSASLPSQTTLASYLGTTTAGTDHIGLVAGALNHYLGTTRYKSVDIYDPPTSAQHTHLKTDIVDLITEGWPLVANVISGWRPPGYPSGTIYHYVAIVGFDEGGEKVMIADPAGDGAGGSSWSAVPRTYWVSLSNLATWIGGKGYTGR